MPPPFLRSAVPTHQRVDRCLRHLQSDGVDLPISINPLSGRSVNLDRLPAPPPDSRFSIYRCINRVPRIYVGLTKRIALETLGCYSKHNPPPPSTGYRVFVQHPQWGPRVLSPAQLGVVADGNTTLGRLTFLLPRAGKEVVTNICTRSSSSRGRGARPWRIPVPRWGGTGKSPPPGVQRRG